MWQLFNSAEKRNVDISSCMKNRYLILFLFINLFISCCRSTWILLLFYEFNIKGGFIWTIWKRSQDHEVSRKRLHNNFKLWKLSTFNLCIMWSTASLNYTWTQILSASKDGNINMHSLYLALRLTESLGFQLIRFYCTGIMGKIKISH